MAAQEIYEPIRFDFASATTWLINHGLQRAVLFQVFNASDQEIEAEHEYVDDENFKINFNRSIAGHVMVA